LWNPEVVVWPFTTVNSYWVAHASAQKIIVSPQTHWKSVTCLILIVSSLGSCARRECSVRLPIAWNFFRIPMFVNVWKQVVKFSVRPIRNSTLGKIQTSIMTFIAYLTRLRLISHPFKNPPTGPWRLITVPILIPMGIPIGLPMVAVLGMTLLVKTEENDVFCNSILSYKTDIQRS